MFEVLSERPVDEVVFLLWIPSGSSQWLQAQTFGGCVSTFLGLKHIWTSNVSIDFSNLNFQVGCFD